MDQMTSHADQLATAYGHHVAGRLSRAEVLYRAILEAEPDNSDALQLLALLMAQTERPAIAADLFRDAVALRPEFADLHYNLANASREIGRPADAAAACRRALALRPDFVEARVTLSDVLLEAAVISAMRARPREVPPYNLLTQRSTPAEQLLCARGMARRLSDGRSQKHRLARGGRIRLGYISADLREHPVGWATAGLLEAHDRAKFATHAYAYGPDDCGATRTRIATGCARFTNLSALGDGWGVALIDELQPRFTALIER